MFICIHEFFPPGRPTQEDNDLIYKRKDKAPFQMFILRMERLKKYGNTFGEEQSTLDVVKKSKEFVKRLKIWQATAAH